MRTGSECIGNVVYWPLAGLTKSEQLDSYFGTNFIIPISNIGLNNKINDLKYVSNYERIFFITSERSDIIYSQYFPNILNPGEKKSKFNITQYWAKENNLSSKNFDGCSIKKIASTNKHLFVIVKNGDNYEIIKIALDNSGFRELIYKLEIDLNQVGGDLAEFEFFINDLSDYESEIWLLNKSVNKIFCGKFRSRSFGKKINFESFEFVSSSIIEPTSFCFFNKEKENLIAILDSNSNNIFMLKQNLKSNKYVLSSTIKITNEEYIGMCYVNFNVQNLPTKLLDNKSIPLLFLYSKIGIWTLNLESEIQNKLMGDGKDDFLSFDDVLTNIFIKDLDFIYSISNSYFVIGSARNERIYILLTLKAKNFLESNRKGSIQKKSTRTESIDDHDIS